MTSVRWHQLRHGDPAHTILAVDYGEGRREAGFPELASSLPAPGAVLATQFSPAGMAELARSGTADPEIVRAAIRGWADELLAGSGAVPRAVMSYCAGAAPACVLADQLAALGVSVPVIMLDPLVAVPEFLLGRFVEAARGLAAILGDAAVETAVREAALETRKTTETSGRTVAECAESLSARYRTIVFQACDEAELGDEAAEELSAHLAGVLHYQAVTALAVTDDLWRPSTDRQMSVLLSQEHPDTAPFPAATTRFDIDRDSFLTDPALAAAVSAIIAKAEHRLPAQP